ncbi:hypothetical protein [Paenibacillus profundus]|nr:hypothetical protein [Paenibacillus profundus]
MMSVVQSGRVMKNMWVNRDMAELVAAVCGASGRVDAAGKDRDHRL